MKQKQTVATFHSLCYQGMTHSLPSLVSPGILDGFERILEVDFSDSCEIFRLNRDFYIADPKTHYLIPEVYYVDQPNIPLIVFVMDPNRLHSFYLSCSMVRELYEDICSVLEKKRRYAKFLLHTPGKFYHKGWFSMELPSHVSGYGKSKWFWNENSAYYRRNPALLLLFRTPMHHNYQFSNYQKIHPTLWECSLPYFPELCAFEYITESEEPLLADLTLILRHLDSLVRTGHMSHRASILCQAMKCGYPSYFVDHWGIRHAPAPEH